MEDTAFGLRRGVARDRDALTGLIVGAIALTPGFRLQIAGEDPIFYGYEFLIALALAFAIRAYYLRKTATPLRWSTPITVAVVITFILASILGDQPLLSLGIARVTIEAAILAWSLKAILQRYDWQFFLWSAVGGVLVHGTAFIVALAQGTEGTYEVTLTVRNEVRMLGGSLNSAAAQFLMLLPLLTVGMASSHRVLRISSIAGVGLATWALVISESRALAGGLAVLVGGFILGALRGSPALPRGLRLAGVVFAVGVIVANSTPEIVDFGNLAVDRVVDLVTSSDSSGGGPDIEEPPEDIDDRNESSDIRRQAAWQLAIEAFVENPVLGTGFQQRFLEGARQFFAHNVIFENLAGTGTLGTLSFLAAAGLYAVGWFRRTWQYARIVLVFGVVAGFAVAIVQPFLNTSHHYTGAWWLMLGLGAVSSLELGSSTEQLANMADEPDADGGSGDEPN